MKKLCAAGIIFAVAAAGLSLLPSARVQAQDAGGDAPAEVGVIVIATEQVTVTQDLNGRVTPYLIAEVRPQVNGIILDRMFEEGSDVREDQQLYQIDPAMYEAQLASAEATLAKAHANVDVAEAKLARYERLIAANAVNKQEYDEVEAATKQAQAEVGIAEAQVKLAQINVDYAKVLSPISGRIGKSNVTQGALVNANQTEPLAVVQQLDPIYVDVSQPISFMLDFRDQLKSGFLANTGESHGAMRLLLSNGKLYSEPGDVLFADVTVEQTTGSISIRGEFPNPDHVLLPGMYVTVQVDVARLDDAITVPQSALQRDQDGSALVLVVQNDGTVERRKVETIRTVGGKWLLGGGVVPGEKVVVDGQQRIRFMPGAPAPRVRPVIVQ